MNLLKLIVPLFLFSFFIILGCNTHPKNKETCSIMNLSGLGGYLLFNKVSNLDINKISFVALENTSKNKIYLGDKLEKHEKTISILKIDKETSVIIENNCYIIINDELKYKITDVMIKKIERQGMLGATSFQCKLKQYKVNDSLVKNKQTVFLDY